MNIASVKFLLLLLPTFSFCQITISDSLQWTSNTQVTSQTSPDFDYCNQQTLHYTLSTSSLGGFRNITATSNGSIPNGAIFPAWTSTNTELNIPINISFSHNVAQVWIKFVDLDEDHDNFYSNPEEYLNSFSPSPDSTIDVVGNFAFNGVTVAPNGNNTEGWVCWNSTLNNISFNYHKPGSGYGLVIGEIRIVCDSSTIVIPEPPPPVVTVPDTSTCEGIEAFVPNVITPNRDELNDSFELEVDPCWENIQFVILNRWGNEVVKLKEAPFGWDGNDTNGTEMAEGTYFWVLEYDNPDLGKQKHHGFITLIK